MNRRRLTIFALTAALSCAVWAGRITIHATDRPAEKVFAEVMKQDGGNFVYSAGLLNGLRVSVNADNAPTDRVLDRMFEGTDIIWSRKGKNIVLQRRKVQKPQTMTVSGYVREAGSGEPLVGVNVSAGKGNGAAATNALGLYQLSVPLKDATLTFSYPGYESVTVTIRRGQQGDVEMQPSASELAEVVVEGSINRSLAMDATSIGRINVSREAIAATPVILGEKDVIKTLQLEPGVSAGVEGMAGMYVHGGNTDENLYMLDNIPLYQVNHFGGLFSAFNTAAIRNVDFYKSTFPARYDGRLSSFIDVRTADGSKEGYHGSFKLGLTSGAFDIGGPIGERTTFQVALRRSWYDILTLPTFAIVNSKKNKDEKYYFNYAFTDLNIKLNHRFSERSSAYVMFYYGDDYISVTEKWKYNNEYDYTKDRLRWGNIVTSAGWHYVFKPELFGEITAAWSRYGSHLKHTNDIGEMVNNKENVLVSDRMINDNSINDLIAKADFNWKPGSAHTFDFGVGYTRHRFLPSKVSRSLMADGMTSTADENTQSLGANELNAYLSGDWSLNDNIRINYGAHYSLFNISGKTHNNLSPRISARWTPADGWAVKGGYSRTVQYVHQLFQSSISLPTDQWVPIAGSQKPQSADKIAAGVYRTLPGGWTLSAEAYWKWMRNLLEYAEEYYLLPPEIEWNDKLTDGSGTAKGIDLKVSREFGKLTGHLSYSLMWADRKYAGLNGGRKFPARFDNRHKINILVSWQANKKWEFSAAWTGMTGNRFTLPVQMWDDPYLGPWHYDMLLQTEVNNYRLPFYNRLDVSAKRNTKHGYWEFSLYNAYCNMNAIGVRRDYDSYQDQNGTWQTKPVFQKIKLLPIIPSVSYTWIF